MMPKKKQQQTRHKRNKERVIMDELMREVQAVPQDSVADGVRSIALVWHHPRLRM